jgi:DNA-binding Lrp family transcriptional regulator
MLSDLEKQIVRELQAGLPLVDRPYLKIATKIGLSETELMDKIREMIKRGIIRRFGAALRHQDLGFTANAMIVWDVPENAAARVGRLMAEFNEVTHCYQRPRLPGWPYTIFTVIHGHARQDCERVAQKIAQKTGITNYRLIYSTKELKKSSMKYFMD